VTALAPTTPAAALALLEQACRLLAEVRLAGEAGDLRHKARAIEVYLRQQEHAREAALDAAEIRLRAERKAGQLLAATVNHNGSRGVGSRVEPTIPEGISKKQSHLWQQAAALPEGEFERVIAEGREVGELSTSAVVCAAKAHARRERAARAPLSPLPLGGGGDAAAVLAGSALWSVARADCLDFMASLPADGVDLVFGSPDYPGARLYLEDGRDPGIVKDVPTWVPWLVEVYRAALRCCRGLVALVVDSRTEHYAWSGAPALLMADLLRAGVTLRDPCIYHRVGVPGSGGSDWLRGDTEFVVCATRGGKLPWSDNTALGQEPVYGPGGEMSYRLRDGSRVNGHASTEERNNVGPHRARMRAGRTYVPPDKANPGNVVFCTVGGGNMGSPLAHENEAPFPEDLAEFFVRSFCPPGGVVLDCFSGSGTTGAVAVRHGRRFVGCDLRQSQVELSRRRVGGAG
jgi:hypothetical protein